MRLMLVVVLLVGGAAWAGKKTVVVGSGDCKDGILVSTIKDFHDLARGVVKSDLFEGDAVLRLVRPPPNRGVDDISRQVDTARSLLYSGQNERGLELATDALTDLERVSPQAHPWPVTLNALVLAAQMLKNLDRPRESADAFRRLLRIEPQYKLDPESYPPSTIQAFEAVRKELARVKKTSLQVNSSPAGATVFLDGREVGRTPLKLDLPPGQFRLSLVSGDGLSFPRKVTAGRDEVVQVDMAFEGGVGLQPPLCVNSTDDDRLAIRLASAVSADQVVVVRNAGARGNPPYLTGALYDARGEKVRNAGVRPEQLRDLVMYLFTGKPDISALPPPAPVKSADVPVAEPKAPEKTAEKMATAPPTPPPAPAPEVPVNGPRIAGFVALGLGAALGVSGAVTLAVGGADRATLAQLRQANGGRLPTESAPALALIDLINRNQAVSWVLIGSGVGTAVAGLLAVVLFPQAPVVLSLSPTPQGGSSVSLSGTFAGF